MNYTCSPSTVRLRTHHTQQPITLVCGKIEVRGEVLEGAFLDLLGSIVPSPPVLPAKSRKPSSRPTGRDRSRPTRSPVLSMPRSRGWKRRSSLSTSHMWLSRDLQTPTSTRRCSRSTSPNSQRRGSHGRSWSRSAQISPSS